MSEGDYGLYIWSGLDTDPHRTHLGQELLLTYQFKRACDSKALCFYLHSSKFTCLHFENRSPETAPCQKTHLHFLFIYTNTLHYSFPFYQEKIWGNQNTKKAEQSKDLYMLYTASAPFGLAVPPAARLTLTEQQWYPQTCQKTFSTWHVIWRSRCQLTKAAQASIETKAPKWHPATAYCTSLT